MQSVTVPFIRERKLQSSVVEIPHWMMHCIYPISANRYIKFTGEQNSVEQRRQELSNVTILTNTRVQEITGEDKVDSIILDNGGTIAVDGVFEAVGMIPNTELLKNLDVLDEKGYVIAGEDCNSSLAGLFVAGDVRTKSLRQVVTAVADGAVAIQSATGYIKGME